MIIKRILFATYLASVGVPLFSQTGADTTYLFRFKAEKDMFYVPYRGNEKSLEELLSVLSANMEQLKNGERYISVSSYGASSGKGISSTRMSRLRSLRVKSELILRGKVTESMFVTDRHIASPYQGEMRNVVVVTFPASVEKVARIAGPEAAARVEAYNRKVSGEAERERLAAEAAENAAREAKEKAEAERLAAEQARLQTEAEAKAAPCHFALRANLLRWATLTPDLGVEWRINRHVGVSVNGTFTSWTWNNNDRRYALWEVTPEVRYYLGYEKRGYMGVMYKAGAFDYKLSSTGKQGDLMGGGITGGYRMRLNNAFAMDFSLGLGYLRADYEKYVTIDGVRVTRGEESKNWWGPVHAGVTLVWNLF